MYRDPLTSPIVHKVHWNTGVEVCAKVYWEIKIVCPGNLNLNMSTVAADKTVSNSLSRSFTIRLTYIHINLNPSWHLIKSFIVTTSIISCMN